MDKLNELEKAVLNKVLSGDHSLLGVLRSQAAVATAKERKWTGTGFITTLLMPTNIPRAPVRTGWIRFGDVAASVDGLVHGAGFLVYLKDGILEAVEGYAYEEPWPKGSYGFSLSYMDGSERDFGELQSEMK